MTTHAVSDTTALLGRSLRHITRSLDTIITTALMPIAMLLLFVYVFGGAIDTGGVPYVNYLLPGILLITIATGISYTAFRLFQDKQSGIIERFASMPIGRPAVLWAHVLTSVIATLISLVLVLAVAVLMGFRSAAGPVAWLAVGGILLPVTLALTWLAVIPGLLAKTADGAGAGLPTDLPAVRQFGLRPDGHDARPGARLCGAPADHRDRQCVALTAQRTGRRQRWLAGPRLVRGDPRHRVCRCHRGAPAARSLTCQAGIRMP